jgi:hypothetical protein
MARLVNSRHGKGFGRNRAMANAFSCNVPAIAKNGQSNIINAVSSIELL